MCDSETSPPRLSFSAYPVDAPDSLTVFQMSPFKLALDESRPEEQKKPWQYEVAVKNVSGAEIRLALVSEPGGGIEIDVPDDDIEPGKEVTIKVKLDRGIADQLFTKSFTVEASDSAATRFTMPIEKAMRWGPAPTSSR